MCEVSEGGHSRRSMARSVSSPKDSMKTWDTCSARELQSRAVRVPIRIPATTRSIIAEAPKIWHVILPIDLDNITPLPCPGPER